MKYISTRNKSNLYNFEEAIYEGLASDGGLLIPQYIPNFSKKDLADLHGSDYVTIASRIISAFWDISEDVLKDLCAKSYANFSDKRIVSVVKMDNFYIAELFYGPTLAFKDLAMQFLGNLLEYLNIKENKNINILGATSGDTGSAAIYSVKGKLHIKVFILYPYKRVSPIQEKQMITHEDYNIEPIAIEGSFDDCQYIVKSIFMNQNFKSAYNLIAVNSINLARIVAQIVYYFYIYLSIMGKRDIGKPLNFVVPTGNFGNVFAGYMAKRMGLPIDKLIIATNENDILKEFITKGIYRIKDVKPTYSPSMDITVASNFERYLFYLTDENDAEVRKLMEELKNTSKIEISKQLLNRVHEDFLSESTSNDETIDTIFKMYEKYKYIVDPHTACGINAYFKLANSCKEDTVCLATAHFAKFPEIVEKAINQKIVYPNEISILFSKQEKYTVLANNVELVKNYIEEKAIR
jgi:threonine synthase